MKPIRTHYQNLKVAENADSRQIRAAYRALCRRWHPDLHPDNPEAAKNMSIINRAYRVLSDPEQRRAHDLWIARQRRAGSGEADEKISGTMPGGYRKAETPLDTRRLLAVLLTVFLLLCALALLTARMRNGG